MNKGPWEVKSTELIYKDRFIEVKVDDVIGPDNNDQTYSTVKLKAGVAVVALDADGQIYLTRQFRYALNKHSVELVSGGIEQGVDPLTTAQKELREEIGFEAGRWEPLGVMHLETSVIDCPAWLYIARDLTEVGEQQEATEDIQWFKVPFAQAADMVIRSEITHGPSCVAILKAFQQGAHES